jgi:hypothetical protein
MRRPTRSRAVVLRSFGHPLVVEEFDVPPAEEGAIVVAVDYGGVCDPADAIGEIIELTGGRGADLVIECTGVPSAVDGGNATINPHQIVYALADHGDALRDVADGAVMKAVLTARRPEHGRRGGRRHREPTGGPPA